MSKFTGLCSRQGLLEKVPLQFGRRRSALDCLNSGETVWSDREAIAFQELIITEWQHPTGVLTDASGCCLSRVNYHTLAIALKPIPSAYVSEFRAIACSTPQILTPLNQLPKAAISSSKLGKSSRSH
ncbi:hypothetical protein [Oscillatoria acuminata]|uniref:hypothetical protein n=1 Tax=Oscillatoria acuminata TaxID=118323 RepID=UPI0018DC0361|nr:hypothetical protein [Oscillatoria acuminata]